METPPQPSLAISAQPSFLNGITLGERVYPSTVSALLSSGKLQDHWNMEKYAQKNASEQGWANEAHLLQNYASKFNAKTFVVPVKYSRYSNTFGRVYPVKGLGLSSMSRFTRNTLIRGDYLDFDLKNAQPSIVRNICEANDIDCPILTKYCDNREECLTEIMNITKCKRGDAKRLMIRLSFFGTFDAWLRENKLEANTPCPSVVRQYVKELNHIADLVKKANPDLFKLVCDANRKKGKVGNDIGSFFSKYLQEYELRIVETTLKWIIGNTNICDCKEDPTIKIATYEYDGLKLLSSRVLEREGGVAAFVDDLNQVTYDLTGFDVMWEVKDMDEDFHEIERPLKNEMICYYEDLAIKEKEKAEKKASKDAEKQKKEDKQRMADEDIRKKGERKEYVSRFITELDMKYEKMKLDFEETHCKIIKTGTYIEIDPKTKQYTERCKSKLHDCYCHLVYGEDLKGVPQHFIDRWVRDENIRTCNDVGFYPNPEDCPPHVLNLWLPFKMELVEDYVPNPDAVEKFRDHIRILCRDTDNPDDETQSNWMLQFLAHLIQYPSIKPTVTPTLISEEGAGKGYVIELIRAMLGDERVKITSSPETEIWGQFNGCLQHAILIELAEVDYRNTKGADGKIKDLISKPMVTINRKGMEAFDIPSYHRYIGTTNSPFGCFKIENGVNSKNRRFTTIRCDDVLCNNHTYFNDMFALLKNVNDVKSIYEYLKSMPDVPKQLVALKTEYEAEVSAPRNKNPYLEWVEYYVLTEIAGRKQLIDRITNGNLLNEEMPPEGDLIVEMRSTKAFNTFINFCKNRKKLAENISSVMFGVGITALRLKGVGKGKRYNDGFSRVFNIDKLYNELNLKGVCLDVEGDDSDDE